MPSVPNSNPQRPRRRPLQQQGPRPSQSEPIFDFKPQVKQIEPYIISGEKLYAVLDCKDPFTGFVGLTDRRIMFYDQAVMLQHKNMMSIPFQQIVAVAASDDGVVFRTSKITIFTPAGQFTFDFRGEDKARLAYEYIMGKILNLKS